MAACVCEVCGCFRAAAYERRGGKVDGGGRYGVLCDEVERGLECKGKAGSWVDTPTVGVAGDVSERHLISQHLNEADAAAAPSNALFVDWIVTVSGKWLMFPQTGSLR